MTKRLHTRAATTTKAALSGRVERPLLARILGVSIRQIANLETEGVVVPERRGRGGRASVYALDTVVPAYVEHVRRQESGSREGETPRDRRDRSQAELNELKLMRERRELLPRHQVVTEGQAFAKALAAKLRALPARMLRAGAISATAAPVFEELLREVQTEIASWSTHIDLLSVQDDEAA
jgi:phage terminase Nu1 subunit (DNA packaging protein)